MASTSRVSMASVAQDQYHRFGNAVRVSSVPSTLARDVEADALVCPSDTPLVGLDAERCDYSEVLECAPSPQANPILRYSFAMAFGTGWKVRRCHPLSVMLLFLMLVGYAVWIRIAVYNVQCEWTETIARHGNSIKATAASLLLWASKFLAVTVLLWSFTCSVLYIHLKRYSYCPFSSRFHTSHLRRGCSTSNRVSGINTQHSSGHTKWCWLHALPDVISLWSLAITVAISWDYICRMDMSNVRFPETGRWWKVLESVFYVHQIWLSLGAFSGLAVFAAICNDVIVVIRSNGQVLLGMASLDTVIARSGVLESGQYHPGLLDSMGGRPWPTVCDPSRPLSPSARPPEPCSGLVNCTSRCQEANTSLDLVHPVSESIVRLLTLQRYVEDATKLPCHWFAVHFCLCVLSFASYVGGQLLFYLAREKRTEGGDYVFVGILMLGMMASFCMPLFAASRVTNTMDDLVRDMQRSLLLARCLKADDHTRLLTFLHTFRRGLYVCGARITTLRTLEALVVVAGAIGLTRSI